MNRVGLTLWSRSCHSPLPGTCWWAGSWNVTQRWSRHFACYCWRAHRAQGTLILLNDPWLKNQDENVPTSCSHLFSLRRNSWKQFNFNIVILIHRLSFKALSRVDFDTVTPANCDQVRLHATSRNPNDNSPVFICPFMWSISLHCFIDNYLTDVIQMIRSLGRRRQILEWLFNTSVSIIQLPIFLKLSLNRIVDGAPEDSNHYGAAHCMHLIRGKSMKSLRLGTRATCWFTQWCLDWRQASGRGSCCASRETRGRKRKQSSGCQAQGIASGNPSFCLNLFGDRPDAVLTCLCAMHSFERNSFKPLNTLPFQTKNCLRICIVSRMTLPRHFCTWNELRWQVVARSCLERIPGIRNREFNWPWTCT